MSNLDDLGVAILALPCIILIASVLTEFTPARIIARYDCGGYEVTVHDRKFSGQDPRGFMTLRSGSRSHAFNHAAHPSAMQIRRGGVPAQEFACHLMRPDPEGGA